MATRKQESLPTRRQALGCGAAAFLGCVDAEEAQGSGRSPAWQSALTLDRQRRRIAGGEDELAAAIGRGADLRIYTEFVHNEHIDPESENDEVVYELSEFHVTYLLENRWAAGIMTQRQPVNPLVGFGDRPSMSFFMYNQNGQQAIARPYLDGIPPVGDVGPSPPPDTRSMPKMHIQDSWDADTNAPSSNFIYDFDTFRYFVRDDWRELFAHDADGSVVSGSYDALADACRQGAEVKVGIRGLCTDLAPERRDVVKHEVFIKAGWLYNHAETRRFSAALHPLVRVAPSIPLRYRSKNWDFGWLLIGTDGQADRWLVDPYTLKFSKSRANYALRWFVRL